VKAGEKEEDDREEDDNEKNRKIKTSMRGTTRMMVVIRPITKGLQKMT